MLRRTLIFIATLFVWTLPAQSADIFAEPWRCSALKDGPLKPGEVWWPGFCSVEKVEGATFVYVFPEANRMRVHRLHVGGWQDYIEAVRKEPPLITTDGTILPTGDTVVAAGVLLHGKRSFWKRMPEGATDPDPENTRRWDVEWEATFAMVGDVLRGELPIPGNLRKRE